MRYVLLLLSSVSCIDIGEPFTDAPDCSVCTDDELCSFSYDFDGSLMPVRCLQWPEACLDDRTCDCIESEADTTGTTSYSYEKAHPCGQIGYPPTGETCSEIEGRPAVQCLTTLG